ncbi:hypothetical protein BV210_02365 [Halorientalis sp. IM1011]|uniref:hypothetical protein n=1 Tax=Halorientalis sp. IM1011 TaxID=1932360 RepID=UPI00097CC9EA|nr:hypothetical protein [Halorientalis sp. IM1011]AQL41628.1 hypothetical protein BV210_02365 [Halorientalis sp. IM1011]
MTADGFSVDEQQWNRLPAEWASGGRHPDTRGYARYFAVSYRVTPEGDVAVRYVHPDNALAIVRTFAACPHEGRAVPTALVDETAEWPNSVPHMPQMSTDGSYCKPEREWLWDLHRGYLEDHTQYTEDGTDGPGNRDGTSCLDLTADGGIERDHLSAPEPASLGGGGDWNE